MKRSTRYFRYAAIFAGLAALIGLAWVGSSLLAYGVVVMNGGAIVTALDFAVAIGLLYCALQAKRDEAEAEAAEARNARITAENRARWASIDDTRPYDLRRWR